MSLRRQAVERNLPEESAMFCKYLWQTLSQAEVHMSDQDIRLIGKIYTSFVMDTLAGKQSVMHLLRAEVKPASILKTYFKASRERTDENRIKSQELQEFRGFIYKGTTGIPIAQIEVVDKEETRVCDCCGGWFPADYCTRTVEVVKQTGQSRIEIMCNHCRAHSENPRIRDTGSSGTCGACEKVACEFHPRHAEHNKVVALLPPARHEFNKVPDGIAVPPGWSR